MVLTASLSAINSDVFGVGRMLHGMAEQGSTPKVFAKTSRRGIPWVTVLVMTIALLFTVYLNFTSCTGKRLSTVICFAGDVCDGMGMDYNPAGRKSPSIVVYRRKGKSAEI